LKYQFNAMTDNSKSLRLRELTNAVSASIEKLQSGNLSRTELEKLTEQSKELYERLIVLRYLAYQTEIKGVEPEISEEITKDVQEEIPVINFKIEELKNEGPVQVSLIDAIEEVTKTEIEVPFSTPVVEAEKSLEQEHVNEHQDEVEVESTPPKPATTLNEFINFNSQKESLHERLAKEIHRPESIGSALEHNPIPDLKRAITLNQRFQFSKELFKGNNQDYEVAIDKLNSVSRDEALKHLELLRNKYAWNSESLVAHDFVDLVERRHL
jgi:hypothetical protein